MTISFIIPSYNTKANLLLECLQSIACLPLSSSEREIIVVDDGSYVPVEEVIAGTTVERAGKQVPLLGELKIIRQRNSGQSTARNVGMDAAKGDFLQFVDSDDYIIASEEMKVIERLKEGDVDMVMFKFSNRKNAKWNKTNGVISGVQFMKHNNLRSTPCLYAFRNTYTRFPEGLIHEDEQFTTLQTVKTKRLCCINALPYFYRHSNDSTTTRSSDAWVTRRLNDTERIIRNLYMYRDAAATEEERDMIDRKRRQLCMDYLYNTWTLTHSPSRLRKTIKSLKSQKFYPLGIRLYTWKYFLFSLFTNIVRL